MEKSEKSKRPFNKEYVINHTMTFLNRSIDMSIMNTVKRIAEFDGDQEKSTEIFQTLSELHILKTQLNALIKQPKEEMK
jgi:hypothetical protein